MAVCSALGCTNSYQKGFIMKRFPKDPGRRQTWLNHMKRSKWKPTENCRICEIHFAPEMWERTRADGQRKLKRNAVPTIFTFPDNDDKAEDDEDEEETRRRPTKRRRIVTRGTNANNDDNCSNSSNDITEIQSSSSSVSNETGNNSNQGCVYNPFSLTTTTTTTSTTTGINQNYPIHQDVKFSKLPFYDIVAELLKPSSLIPNSNQYRLEQTFNFGLTPQQTIDILHSKTITSNYLCDFEIQIQLRFCLSETNCEQDDYYPSELLVKVNNRVCALPPIVSSTKPGTKLKRFSKPINITPYVKLTSTVMNSVTVVWSNINIGPGYTISINLVKKLTAGDLVKRLKEKGVMNPDYTRSLIKEKLNDTDSEIVTTCLRVSLICPLGKMRMLTPCRATSCNHLQCFDSSLFLQMNEKKSSWICPVCDKPILYNNLIIDGYFKDVLTSNHLPSDINEIELHKDGTWSIHKIDTNNTINNCINNNNNNNDNQNCIDDTIEIICDDDDDDDGDLDQISTTINNKQVECLNVKDLQPVEIIDLIDSDSDDGDKCEMNQITNIDIANCVISLDTSSPSSVSSKSSSSASSTSSSSSSAASTSSYSPSRSPSSSSFCSLQSIDDNLINHTDTIIETTTTTIPNRIDEEFINSSIIKNNESIIPIQEDICSQSNHTIPVSITNLPTTNDLINNGNLEEISSTINHNDLFNYLPLLNKNNLQ